MLRLAAAFVLAILGCRVGSSARSVDGDDTRSAALAAVDPPPRPETIQLGSDRFRPGARVRRVAVAPDGATLAMITERRVQLWSLQQGIALGESRTTLADLEVLAFADGGDTLVAIDRGAQLSSWPVRTSGLGDATEVDLHGRRLGNAMAIVDVGHGEIAALWGQPFAGDRGLYELAIHRRADGVRSGHASLSSRPLGIWRATDGIVVAHTDEVEVFDGARANRRGSLRTDATDARMHSGAAMLADGTTFVLVAADRMARWDVRTRKLLDTRDIGRPIAGCRRAAIAPAGDRILCEPPVDPPWIAAVPRDPAAAIEPATHVERTVPLFAATDLVWTPDATKLVDTQPWWVPSIWDAETGLDIVAADGPLAPVRAIAWIADDRLLAIDGVGEMRDWDPWAGRPRSRVAPMRIDVTDAAFAPDGREVALCRGGGAEIRTLAGTIRLRSDGACRRVAWRGADMLWISGADELRRIDVRGDVPIQRGRPQPGPHGDVLATADGGTRVATAAGVWNDADEQLWSPPRESIADTSPRLDLVAAIALAEDRLVVADRQGARIVPLAGGSAIPIATGETPVTAIAIAPDHQRIALGDAQGRVTIVLRDGTLTTLARTSHRGPVRGLWWHGASIVSAGDDTTIVVWSPFERG